MKAFPQFCRSLVILDRGGGSMKCSEMKRGQIYVCGDCGLELKVVKECDCSEDSCTEPGCSGEGLTLKT